MLATIEKVLLLKQTPLFARIPGEELARVAEIARQVPFETGDQIIEFGATTEVFYCLIEGEVSLRSSAGRRTKIRAVNTFGEVSFFDRDGSDLAAVALTSMTAFEWHASVFFALLEDRPELARELLAALARRIRAYVAADDLYPSTGGRISG